MICDGSNTHRRDLSWLTQNRKNRSWNRWSRCLRNGWRKATPLTLSGRTRWDMSCWILRRTIQQKQSIETISYKNSVKSYDFTEFLVCPTRFECATYRVGVFRYILIKCCVFKTCAVFTENTRFRWISWKPLKTQGKPAFSVLQVIVVKS